MKSPVAMTQPELEAEAKSLNIPFTEDVKRTDLIKAVSKARKAEKEAQEGNNPSTPKTGNNKGSKVVYYWIKVNSYVDDDVNKSDKLLVVGLYKFDKILKRLEKSPISAVEKFEGEIPERALLKIAEAVGMTFVASDDVDYKDLLSKLVSDVVYKK